MKVWAIITGLICGVPSCFVAVTHYLEYDGAYRYPCQDPTMWEHDDCVPPICLADSTCSKFLVPEGVFDVEGS